MLAGFDTHPAEAHGIRTLDFTLANGKRIHMALKSIDWGEYPNTNPWTLVGYQVTLRPGYSWANYPDDTTVTVKYDPFGKTGEMDLKLVSPCHSEPLIEVAGKGDDLWGWQCAKCHQLVMRISPSTGEAQWLDPVEGNNWNVGLVYDRTVWISYRKLEAGEDELTISISGPRGDVFLETPEKMMPIVPKNILTGIRPLRSPRKECGLYYRLKGNIFELTPDTQATLDKALGLELMHRLRQIQTADKELDTLPLALQEPLPPFSAVVPVYGVRTPPAASTTSGNTTN
jgi:hypothetical protein